MQTFIGIVLGGSFLAFLEFLIQRFDKKHDRFKAIEERIDKLQASISDLSENADRREAVSCRVRILRFEDELQENRDHSKDSFDQVLSDITTYDRYCEKHPDFRNHQTSATVAHITACYNDRLQKHDFLGGAK